MAGDVYSLEGFAVPSGIEELHLLLDHAGSDHPEVDPSDLMLFETAVVEIANNVVEHARPEGEVRWRFALHVRPGELEATLSDSGTPYLGDIGTAMPDELAERGRGMPLAHAILDEFHYSRVDSANHWRMVRRGSTGPAS
ncbi:ATP-binding protein [Nocardioides silvaticus]|uniref:ATP-binding protein n=1 Tax=Nocardioides silvaticus TaxID=2201891 RepID=A0A316TET6_9ACTN|nr:ATP-binding protein [Nocardioides silvaticus]PWN00992.1 ATP-binding protein [Nocardioides silvaticus]